jgi:hypothetical protein
MNSMVAFSNPLTSGGEMKPLQDAFLDFFYFYCKLESESSGLI